MDEQGNRRRWQVVIDVWDRNPSLFATIVAVVCFVLVGLIVVPLSMPSSISERDRAEQLAERFTGSLPTEAGPAASIGELVATYGADGGAACSASLADAWESLLVTAPSGATVLDKAAFARMRTAHATYCPERTEAFAAETRSRVRART
jgi:hypothetical protein